MPVPLFQLFDYWLPDALDGAQTVAPGTRVFVSFGKRSLVGIVEIVHAAVSESPEAERSNPLKAVNAVLDASPILPPQTRRLLAWTARYYHHPIGETYATAIPSALRQAKPAPEPERWWTARSVTDASGASASGLNRAPRQQAVYDTLRGSPAGVSESALRAEHPRGLGPLLEALQHKGLAARNEDPTLPPPASLRATAPTLNTEQQQAVKQIADALGQPDQQFAPFLLDGVTGSGKTEVYLHAIADALDAGRQVLVLAPEIGLAPQLLNRLHARFHATIGTLHSGLSQGERAKTWMAAARGELNIVVGTRSSVFVPMKRLGLMIVDEAHDGAYKQEDGLRYNARDVALRRAQLEQVPVVLGSATPSLESLHNAEIQRFAHLKLTQRAGAAQPPQVDLIDLRGQAMADQNAGLSNALIQTIEDTLARGEQVLLFLNRRGYAPAVVCHSCGWTAHCHRCNANMTWHRASRELRCHHCGATAPEPTRCPPAEGCGSRSLMAAGQGTERLEEALRKLFPGVAQLRIDRDSTRRVGALDAALAKATSGEAQLIIGTQMLAKGHDFPNLTLVAVVDADQGLFSADFRAREHMAQLLVQVAGRSGRSSHTGRAGRVLIQTHQPEHPLLQTMARAARGTAGNLYAHLAPSLLAERKGAQFPPYSRLALLRAESTKPGAAQQFLEQAAADARATLADMAAGDAVDVWSPMHAPMPLRAGRHRAQLMLESTDRAALQRLLARWVPSLASADRAALARKVRWSIDVDPQSMD